MKVDLDPEEIERVTKALEHYWAYLVAVQREDHAYQRLAERFRAMAH